MAPRGELKPGSIATRVLEMIDTAGQRPVPRSELHRRLPPVSRNGLGRALERLLDARQIVIVPGGFLLAGRVPAAREIVEPPTVPQPVPEPLRRQLDAIQRRAHALRFAGERAAATLLLAAASRHPALPRHVQAGFAALADLFRHHDPDGAAA